MNIYMYVDPVADRRPEVVGLVTSLIQYFNILLVGFFLASFVLGTFAFINIDIINVPKKMNHVIPKAIMICSLRMTKFY